MSRVGERAAAKRKTQESATLFFCPVHKSRISREACLAFCTAPRNNVDRCTREFACPSSWRLCWACIAHHGLGGRSKPVDDPTKGLCEFHAAKGIEAVPTWIAQEREQSQGHHGSTIDEIRERIESHKVARNVPKPEVEAPLAPVVPLSGNGHAKKEEDGRYPVDAVLEVDCSRVRPLKDQPRSYFDEERFNGLVNSIGKVGQLEIVPAVSLPDGTFRIRDGERRWRACTKLRRKLRIIVVQELSYEEEVEQAAVLNFNRQEHTPVEKARIFLRLRDGELKRTVAEIAHMFGVTTQTVYNHIILLEKLTPKVQELLDPVLQGGMRNILGSSIAQYLTAFFDRPKKQEELAQKILKNKLNLREAKVLIDREASKLGIKTGRGREAKAHDHIVILKRMLTTMGATLDRFEGFSEEEWRRLWVSRSWLEREQIAERLKKLEARLNGLRVHINESLGRPKDA